MKNAKTFSDRLIECRISSRLTQQTLADMSGFSLRSIQNWETGLFKPNSDKVRQLAALFDVSVAWLMGEDIDASDDLSTVRLSEDERTLIDGLRRLPSVERNITIEHFNKLLDEWVSFSTRRRKT